MAILPITLFATGASAATEKVLYSFKSLTLTELIRVPG